MKTFAPRVLGALLLLALAVPSRAAGRAPARDSVESWRESVAHPESFSRLADGSLSRDGVVAEPAASAASPAPGAAVRPRYTLGADDFRRSAGPVPVLTTAAASAATADAPSRRTDPLPWAAAFGVAGLVLVAVLSTKPAAPVEGAPAAAPPPFEAAAPAAPRAAVRTPLPTVESYLAREPRVEPFVDARMPVATWRAIAWREQRLIEGWDASPEKASGRVSLDEWIDRHGAASGVDGPLLKAKLARPS
ncbi:MAG: hypothetical protein HY079_08705 [Elusimicrobia bacterium]|nr:hypothetical protein [Elusimicrobiota bacterium]